MVEWRTRTSFALIACHMTSCIQPVGLTRGGPILARRKGYVRSRSHQFVITARQCCANRCGLGLFAPPSEIDESVPPMKCLGQLRLSHDARQDNAQFTLNSLRSLPNFPCNSDNLSQHTTPPNFFEIDNVYIPGNSFDCTLVHHSQAF